MSSEYKGFKDKEIEYKEGDGKSLYTDKCVDKHLKVVKSGGENTPLELSTESVKIASNLDVNGEISTIGDVHVIGKIRTYGGQKSTLIGHAGADVDFQSDNNVKLASGDSHFIQFYHGDTIINEMQGSGGYNLKMYNAASPGDGSIDFANMSVGTNGALTIGTVSLSEADITLTCIAGNINLARDVHLTAAKKIYFDGGNNTYITESGADILDIVVGGELLLQLREGGGGASDGIYIPSTTPLYFDSGNDTYIAETAGDTLSIYVGGDNLVKLTEDGTSGNTFDFEDCAAGFTRIEQTFSTTDVKGTGGTDDTDIDFRKSNKFRLEMTGDIAQMNLIFPNVSGNFTLVTSTNGDHDVTAWKVWRANTAAASTTDVMWAGGSVPAFTNNGIDITSFYWDATEQQCYGVCSLAFATP